MLALILKTVDGLVLHFGNFLAYLNEKDKAINEALKIKKL